MKKRLVIYILAALLIAALSLLAVAYLTPGPAAEHAPDFPHADLVIQRSGRPALGMNVELATTREQAAYGLMFRRDLKKGAGMLFLWQPDQQVGMWMKNTYIPLDMLFVAADGTVIKIAEAKPLDLTPISSGQPVRGVIEIGGGEAARLGLKTGDKVVFPAFSPAP